MHTHALPSVARMHSYCILHIRSSMRMHSYCILHIRFSMCISLGLVTLDELCLTGATLMCVLHSRTPGVGTVNPAYGTVTPAYVFVCYGSADRSQALCEQLLRTHVSSARAHLVSPGGVRGMKDGEGRGGRMGSGGVDDERDTVLDVVFCGDSFIRQMYLAFSSWLSGNFENIAVLPNAPAHCHSGAGSMQYPADCAPCVSVLLHLSCARTLFSPLILTLCACVCFYVRVRMREVVQACMHPCSELARALLLTRALTPGTSTKGLWICVTVQYAQHWYQGNRIIVCQTPQIRSLPPRISSFGLLESILLEERLVQEPTRYESMYAINGATVGLPLHASMYLDAHLCISICVRTRIYSRAWTHARWMITALHIPT